MFAKPRLCRLLYKVHLLEQVVSFLPNILKVGKHPHSHTRAHAHIYTYTLMDT